MRIILSFFIFIFGAIIGSFLNVIILRHNTGESVIRNRSRCFSCGKKLEWFELIPIFSFLFQKGRCRQCKSKISWQYPLVEFITGLVFLLVILKISNFQLPIFNQFSIINFQFLNYFLSLTFYFLIFSLLIMISIYDIRHQIIPDKFVYFFIGSAFFSPFIIRNFEFIIRDFISYLSAGPLLFSFFAFLWFVSRGKWMGFGDAKLAFGIGWFLGLEKGILALVVSFWAGAIFGLFLIAFSKNTTLKSKIPFGPFLVFGALVAFFFGDFIVQLFQTFSLLG